MAAPSPTGRVPSQGVSRPPAVNRRHVGAALAAGLSGLAPIAAAAAAQLATVATRPEVQQIQQAYDGYAATYDDLDGGRAAQQLGFPALRRQLLHAARGEVLETAVGTGLNLPFYDTAAVASLTAVDLSHGMLAQARARAEQLGVGDRIRLELVQADVERLQEELDREFDTIVDTFSLCVFPDPAAAMRNMAACLRPGGQLLLLEHSRSGFGPLGWYQVGVLPHPASPFLHVHCLHILAPRGAMCSGHYSASRGSDWQGLPLERQCAVARGSSGLEDPRGGGPLGWPGGVAARSQASMTSNAPCSNCVPRHVAAPLRTSFQESAGGRRRHGACNRATAPCVPPAEDCQRCAACGAQWRVSGGGCRPQRTTAGSCGGHAQ